MPSRSGWRVMLGLLILAAITVWTTILSPEDDRLNVYIFDVGQGDSILIRRGSFEILVDGGPDDAILSQLGRALPSWDRMIEVVVATHPHADHVTGLIRVLSRYTVGEVWTSGAAYDTATYARFLSLANQTEGGVVVVASGEHREVGGMDISVLAPVERLADRTLTNANLSSIIIKVSFGQFDLLLTGDAENEIQQALLARGSDVDADVLKVPHQGSRDAHLPQFIARVSPLVAIISVGQDNRYGHPHQETVDWYETSGITLLRTDRDGTVHVTSDGQTFWINTTKTGIVAEVNLGNVK
jgi:competence protein ComEC